MDERVEISELVKGNEKLLAEAKPDKFVYCILPSLKMLPIAIIWLIFDGFFILQILPMFRTSMAFFLVPFFAIHLFPVYGVFTSYAKRRIEWNNLQYGITTQRVIRVGGALGVEVQAIDHHEIDAVNIKMSWLEKLRHVGTLEIVSDNTRIDFVGIENPVKIYKMLTKTSFDVKTDIEYPNALRPDENPGYKTRYKDETSGK